MSEEGSGPGRRVWLLAGCSTGIGRALAEALSDGGEYVMVTSRDVRDISQFERYGADRVRTHTLDLLEPTGAEAAVQATLAAFGRIDTVVTAAGVGLIGSVEETSTQELRRVLETNVVGTHRLLAAVLPVLRSQKSGHIAAITSSVAFQGIAGCGSYCGSKAALNAILEALAVEVAPLGIGVTILAPGLVRTNFHDKGIARAAERIDDYETTCGPVRRSVEEDYPPTAHAPEVVAQAILVALQAPKPPLHLALGNDAVAVVRARLDNLATGLTEWEELSVNLRDAG
jgi:short-subunit dehydrogenase